MSFIFLAYLLSKSNSLAMVIIIVDKKIFFVVSIVFIMGEVFEIIY